MVAAAGCGDVNGREKPFAGMVDHCAADYHVPALVPPWILEPVTDAPSMLIMGVPRSFFTSSIPLNLNDLTSASQAIESLKQQARFFLIVEQLAGKPADHIKRVLGDHPPPVQTVEPLAGTPVTHVQLFCQADKDRNLPVRLDAFIDFNAASPLANQTIHLAFRAEPGTPSLCDDAMIRAMILGTAPGGTRQQVCR